ncbi:uncharacterized protein LOC134825566 [Bolinopsis microptera]|uniref:uncharacterized protein LOC134825566 n=1 Tax=Bolinopsis microptera TaxID=2820187 RepID=UPI00307AED71
MSNVLFIEISVEEDGGNSAVSYKEDGGRFAETQTIKLSVDTKYSVRISCKEELKTQDMLLNGEAIYMETKPPAPDSDPSLKVYEGRFSTDKVDKTKKAKRDVVALQIPLQYSLLVALQCKYYTLKKKKSTSWGETLKNIVVNYKEEEGVEGTKCVVSSVKCRKIMPR